MSFGFNIIEMDSNVYYKCSNLYYVDFITDVEMCHYAEDRSIIKPDNDEIIASSAKSILVSVPASKHLIEEIPIQSIKEQYECAMLADQKHSPVNR